MFKKLTKRLFGLDDGLNDTEETIVDGQILDQSTGEPVQPREALSEPEFTQVESTVKDSVSGPKPRDASIKAKDVLSECHPRSGNIGEPEQNIGQEEPEADPEVAEFGSHLRFQGDDIPEGYTIFLGAAGKSERTVSEYCYDLKWWNEKKRIERITWRDIERAINKMHAATARRKIAVLRSYSRWLLREGYSRLHGEVGRVIPPKIPGRVPKDRGTDDFKKLSRQAMDLCSKKDRRGLWIGLMLCCGLRISEIKGVELSTEQNIRVIGKGNKERLVPSPKWLYAAIGDEKNKKWRRTRQLIWQELKDMGVKKPHSLRHTYASELIRCGFQLEEVKELLGHSKLDTTLIYAKIKVPERVTNRLGVEEND
ncbi:MAG: tyrosine-type recombinase/integrase [Desulfamplus sp.]|nr:tyrosine-type recombinase/integrase [Desulfamplus sp.]